MEFKYSVRCHNTMYCLVECWKKDWDVYRYICEKKKKKKKKKGAVPIP